MLFFRSEEAVRAWCREHEHPMRPLVTIDQLWRLAAAWYGTRLDPAARRPGPEEIRQILSGIGLTGDFWDPQASGRRLGTASGTISIADDFDELLPDFDEYS